MEFLKDVLGEALYGQVQASVKAWNDKAEKGKDVKLANLAGGAYVSKEKYEDKTAALQAQASELTAQIKQRDKDLSDMQKRLEDAQKDAEKVTEANDKLKQLREKYDADAKAWQKKLADRDYEYAVKEQAAELKFTSVAAKKAFIMEAKEKQFRYENGNLQGFQEWVQEYQTNDPGAFQTVETQQKPAAPFVGPSNSSPTQPLSLTDMMIQANAKQ